VVEKGTVIGGEGLAGMAIAVLAEGASSSVFEHVPQTYLLVRLVFYGTRLNKPPSPPYWVPKA